MRFNIFSKRKNDLFLHHIPAQAMVLEKPDDPRAWIAGYCQQASTGDDGKVRARSGEAGEGSKSALHAIGAEGAAASHHAVMSKQPKVPFFSDYCIRIEAIRAGSPRSIFWVLDQLHRRPVFMG